MQEGADASKALVQELADVKKKLLLLAKKKAAEGAAAAKEAEARASDLAVVKSERDKLMAELTEAQASDNAGCMARFYRMRS